MSVRAATAAAAAATKTRGRYVNPKERKKLAGSGQKARRSVCGLGPSRERAGGGADTFNYAFNCKKAQVAREHRGELHRRDYMQKYDRRRLEKNWSRASSHDGDLII